MIRSALSFVPVLLPRLANVALAFGSTFVLARIAGPEQYGLYAFGFAALGMAATFSTGGIDQLTPRELRLGGTKFLSWSTRRVLMISGIATAVMLALGLSMQSPKFAVVAIFSAAVGAMALLRMFRSRLQAIGRTPLGIALEMPLVNGLLLVFGLALWKIGGATANNIAIGHVCIFIAAASISWLVFSSKWDPVEGTELETWGRSANMFTAIAGLVFLQQNVDVLLVGLLMPAEQVGQYAVAGRVSFLILVGFGPFAMLFAPKIAEQWANQEDAEHSAKMAARLSLLVGLPVALVILFATPLLLHLFGADYAGAATALRILAAGQLLFILFGPGQMVLSMIHEEKSLIWVLAVAMLVGFASTSIGAAVAGIEGAALGRAIFLLAAGAGTFVVAKRRGIHIAVWPKIPS